MVFFGKNVHFRNAISQRLSRISGENLSLSRDAFSPSPRANARFRGGSACGTRINIFILQRCVYLSQSISVPITGHCMLHRARKETCTCIPRELVSMRLSLSLSLNYFTARKAQNKEYIGANERAASIKIIRITISVQIVMHSLAHEGAA